MCSLTQITMMGAVYMTGVLEYLTAEMMELAGNAASTNKKKRITPRHVERTKTWSYTFDTRYQIQGHFQSVLWNVFPQMLAVAFDQELYSLFDAGKVIMPGAGVAPFIHKVSPAGGEARLQFVGIAFRGMITPLKLLFWRRNCCPRMPTKQSERNPRALRKKRRQSHSIRMWQTLPLHSPARPSIHLSVPNLGTVKNTEFLGIMWFAWGSYPKSVTKLSSFLSGSKKPLLCDQCSLFVKLWFPVHGEEKYSPENYSTFFHIF